MNFCYLARRKSSQGCVILFLDQILTFLIPNNKGPPKLVDGLCVYPLVDWNGPVTQPRK